MYVLSCPFSESRSSHTAKNLQIQDVMLNILWWRDVNHGSICPAEGPSFVIVSACSESQVWNITNLFFDVGVVLSFRALWFLQLWTWRQHVSLKRLHQPMKPNGIKTKDNTSIILTVVRNLSLATDLCFMLQHTSVPSHHILRSASVCHPSVWSYSCMDSSSTACPKCMDLMAFLRGHSVQCPGSASIPVKADVTV